MVMIIKPKVTELKPQRQEKRTENERMENYDYLGNNFSRLSKLLFVEALRRLETFSQ